MEGRRLNSDAGSRDATWRVTTDLLDGAGVETREQSNPAAVGSDRPAGAERSRTDGLTTAVIG
jgi:hypothetical protein